MNVKEIGGIYSYSGLAPRVCEELSQWGDDEGAAEVHVYPAVSKWACQQVHEECVPDTWY